jgi:nicotinamidase/pyrazinamidase
MMNAFKQGDALIIADIQNDFLPGGALGIAGGDSIVPTLQAYMTTFQSHNLPIVLTRDWHPANHCSFREQGGPWPVHCVAGSPGSRPPSNFPMPPTAHIIHKAMSPEREAYSAFQDTPLHEQLRAQGVRRVFVGGLATDYCVLNTVKDARALGYEVYLLLDGIQAVNRHPDDGRKAVDEMIRLGAVPIRLENLPA